MPDLKYLYRVLFIAFLNKLLIYFFNKAYYQESNILIISYSSVVTIADWLKMEVWKVEIDFEKPSSGSRHENPKISKTCF